MAKKAVCINKDRQEVKQEKDHQEPLPVFLHDLMSSYWILSFKDPTTFQQQHMLFTKPLIHRPSSDISETFTGENSCVFQWKRPWWETGDVESIRPCFSLHACITSSMVVLTQHSLGRAQRIRNPRSSWLHSNLEASLAYNLKTNFHTESKTVSQNGVSEVKCKYVHF